MANRLGLPLSVGEAYNGEGINMGRGLEILDRDRLTVANALPWVRDEIVRIVNMHDEMLDALRAVLDFADEETGDNQFCECTTGHADAGTVCRSCFALNADRAAIAKATADA